MTPDNQDNQKTTDQKNFLLQIINGEVHLDTANRKRLQGAIESAAIGQLKPPQLFNLHKKVDLLGYNVPAGAIQQAFASDTASNSDARSYAQILDYPVLIPPGTLCDALLKAAKITNNSQHPQRIAHISKTNHPLFYDSLYDRLPEHLRSQSSSVTVVPQDSQRIDVELDELKQIPAESENERETQVRSALESLGIPAPPAKGFYRMRWERTSASDLKELAHPDNSQKTSLPGGLRVQSWQVSLMDTWKITTHDEKGNVVFDNPTRAILDTASRHAAQNCKPVVITIDTPDTPPDALPYVPSLLISKGDDPGTVRIHNPTDSSKPFTAAVDEASKDPGWENVNRLLINRKIDPAFVLPLLDPRRRSLLNEIRNVSVQSVQPTPSSHPTQPLADVSVMRQEAPPVQSAPLGRRVMSKLDDLRKNPIDTTLSLARRAKKHLGGGGREGGNQGR